MNDREKGLIVGFLLGSFVAGVASSVDVWWIEGIICVPLIMVALAWADRSVVR